MAIRPFPIGIDSPPLPGTDRTKIGLLWTSVEKCAQVIRALIGGKLLEYHEDELVNSTGQSITHNLGRLPRGWIITYRDGNRVIYGDKERNTDKTVFMQTGAGTIRASFFLFALLVALIAPSASAACTQGYTQGAVMVHWVCETASDVTAGAQEGALRYNLDTDVLRLRQRRERNAGARQRFVHRRRAAIG